MQPVKMSDKSIARVPERGINTEKSRRIRAQFLEEKTGINLSLLTPRQLVAEGLKNNIESFIGAVEIPIGAAGPLHLKGSAFNEMVYAPIATSEGCLVASISRGANAINLAGGVTATFIKQTMTRMPVFTFRSMAQAYQFSSWSKNKIRQMRAVVRRYSNFAELISIAPQIFGRSAGIKFSFETGDAGGQNMTTTCTWHTCQWLMKEWENAGHPPVETFIIEGNGSCDKKVSLTNFIEGRGCEAVAECEIPGNVLKRVLKVTPHELYETVQRTVRHSAISGMIGYNINVSNVIAGIFAATGQDIACVHESSIAHFSVELSGDNLYSSIRLPSLTIGTVGGGTSLPGQKKMLQMMDCYGPKKVQRFAEIITGFALALELSTSSAVTGGQFALAHEKYGRNHPVNWLKQGELEEEILDQAAREHFGASAERSITISQCDNFHTGGSIVSELCSKNLKKHVGLFPYDFSINGNDKKKSLKTMVKIKALDKEAIQVGTTMAGMGSRELAGFFREHGPKTGFANCHLKELAIYGQKHTKFTDHVPEAFYTKIDHKRELYLLVLERLENTILQDSADDTSGWKEEHMLEVLRTAASFHSLWFDKDQKQLIKQFFLTPRLTENDFAEMKPFYSALLSNARNEFSEIVTETDFLSIQRIIEQIDEWAPLYCSMPATLIHNDFNPRNIAFRDKKGGPKAVVYDWELSVLSLGQRDVAEFLCFVLTDVRPDTLHRLTTFYQKEFSSLISTQVDEVDWMTGFRSSLYDFIIGRLMMYFMAHTFIDYKFIKRVFRSSMDILRIIENDPRQPSCRH